MSMDLILGKCIPTNHGPQDLPAPSSGEPPGSEQSDSHRGVFYNYASHHTELCSASASRLLCCHPASQIQGQTGCGEDAIFVCVIHFQSNIHFVL